MEFLISSLENIKNIISEIKNSIDSFNRRFYTSEVRTGLQTINHTHEEEKTKAYRIYKMSKKIQELL